MAGAIEEVIRLRLGFCCQAELYVSRVRSTLAQALMSAVESGERTYLPEDASVAEVYDFLEARRGAGAGDDVEPRYLLVGADMHEQVELPGSVYRILLQVVEALSQNMAVAVAPLAQKLTTQQAADLLGISRPTPRACSRHARARL